MERVYDKERSYQVQGDCYKYIHKCHNCGEVLFEIKDFIYRKHPEEVNIPKFCSECGSKQ